MKTKKIAVGDIVQLKSGGPRMTVTDTTYGCFVESITCIWYDKNDELRLYCFETNILNVLK